MNPTTRSLTMGAGEPKRLNSKRKRVHVLPERVYLDEISRARVARLHQQITDGLGIDASLTVLTRVALAELEKWVNEVLPPNAAVLIPTEAMLSLKVAFLVAAAGKL